MSLSPGSVAAILRAQFPGLRADSVAWLGEGMDSVAFDVDGAWVFRFPKRQDVEQQLLLEFEILPTVAAASPVPVPDYRFIGQPSDLFPRAFGGYARLPGVPGNVVTVNAEDYRQLAPQVGGFLSALHACPLGLLPGGLPVQPIADVLRELGAAAIGELGSLDRVIAGGPPRRWRSWFEQTPAAESPPAANVLVHGDLAAEHILLDPAERTVTGVIDWSEVAVSGAALDLAALYHWGGDELADAALNHYEQPVTTAMLQQARYIAACRAVLDVAFGLETGRAEYITGALRLLHDAKLPTGGAFMNAPTTKPEVWLRGPVAGVPAPLQPVAHALLQALEDAERLTAGLDTVDVWASPGGAATIGFHLRHMSGSLDRLLSYARGEALDDAQRAALAAEKESTPDASADALLRELRAAINSALEQLRSTPVDTLDERRRVGRAGYPSTVRGLLYHAGEHAARHAGQISTTVRIVQGLRGA